MKKLNALIVALASSVSIAQTTQKKPATNDGSAIKSPTTKAICGAR